MDKEINKDFSFEAEVRRIVNEKINAVLDGLYNVLYNSQGHPEIEFEVLKAEIEAMDKGVNNG